ncbi:alpha amylase C-terminal domain-containing protein [Porphyromonadaceae bacterium W3.11]|nr:alpha amylase C-terminal domain-containing protein [Porphyromonadaceae bacterium W3.11]
MLELIKNDSFLEPYEGVMEERKQKVLRKEAELLKGGASDLSGFATGYLYFGLHQTDKGWIIREWAPNAQAIYLLCDSSHWQKEEASSFSMIGHGVWELELSDDLLHHGDHYKLLITWDGGEGERLPAWTRYVVQDPETYIFTAQVWAPETPYTFQSPRAVLNDEPLLIYESHIGMATEDERVGTYREFQENILPKVVEKGYNAIQLMAVMEHPYYGSFGYQVSNFFAPSSRFGTPDELKELIDTAHSLGLIVIMDLVHSHAVKNEVEGLAKYDGTYSQFFHDGERLFHPQWNSMCFDYGKNEVLHFLLSNCKYWIEEYQFDGFRFDGVTSMLYLDHGLGKAFTSYDDYYNGGQDDDAIVYLTLANKLVHEVYPHAITIAEEVSGMPGLALPIEGGGYGFDYRLAMNIPDFWIKLIKEYEDEEWKPGEIWWQCTNRRHNEKSISYAESHDQALVGDKTIIFRLIDQEMYWHMDRADKSLVVARGIALHKMIRLVTLTTMNGGYLNFMGNEFGHPEWIDFPREGNDWSYKYARRQWSLEDNGFLKYGELGDFDRAIMEFVRSIDHFHELPMAQLWEKSDDQILAYSRGDYLFVYNFHPSKSFVDYQILAPIGKYRMVLSSDEARFGGQELVDRAIDHLTMYDREYEIYGHEWLSLYIPARTAMIFQKVKE